MLNTAINASADDTDIKAARWHEYVIIEVTRYD